MNKIAVTLIVVSFVSIGCANNPALQAKVNYLKAENYRQEKEIDALNARLNNENHDNKPYQIQSPEDQNVFNLVSWLRNKSQSLWQNGKIWENCVENKINNNSSFEDLKSAIQFCYSKN